MTRQQVHIKGLKETQRFLNALPQKFKVSAQNAAYKKILKPYRDRIKANIRKAIPNVDDGVLKSVNTWSVRSGQIGIALGPKKTDENYILNFFERGSKSHVIRTKKKSVLSDGSQVYGRKVTHPGIRPHFMFASEFNKLEKQFPKDAAKDFDLKIMQTHRRFIKRNA